MQKTRLIFMALALAILACLVALALLARPLIAAFFGSSPRIKSTPSIVQQVQTLSQLVTVKYVMEKVVILEDVKWSTWFGESRVLMVAHGVVKAGVDLGEIKANDVHVAKKKVTLKMPPARITDCYLDDKHTQIIERSTGLLRTFDKDLEQNARQQAVQEINLASRQSGILKDAEERAKVQLTHLFIQMGYEEVEFVK